MPQPSPTFLESLANRYNFADSLDWQPLIRHFELGQGFAFIVLLVPNDDWAEVCREALDSFLRSRGEHVMQIPIAAPEDLQNLAGTLLETRAESGAGAIWVARAVPEALPEYPVWFQAWRHGVNWLNQYRNPLRRQFQIPVIFVGAPWLEVVLRDNAPDLWSVQTLVARIKPEAVEPVSVMRMRSLDHGASTRGPDPELALQEANRLRRKPGAELALARLLYRAGMGFDARHQWSEAVLAFTEALEIRQRAEAPLEDVADAAYELGTALTRLSEYDLASRRHVRSPFSLSSALTRLSDYDLASRVLSQARSAYEGASNLLGSARSLRALGDVASRTDPKTANAQYEEALALFRRLGDKPGEAECIASLGDIALQTGDAAGARVHYDQALPLFRSIHNARGEAICILKLGDVAFRQLDLQSAFARYQEALPLFHRIKDAVGQAHCITRLGEIALNRQDLEAARCLFEEAQALLAAARAAFERLGRQDLIALLDREFTPPTPPAASPK